jgi:predicted MFS family arabinose efflux permease
VAAAALLPQVLGSLRAMFDGAERGKVFALFGVTAGVANAAGVLLGGVLTDGDLFGWGWRTIFAVNIPIAAGTLLLGAKWIPASRERAGGRIDVAGNLILALCLVAIVLPLVCWTTALVRTNGAGCVIQGADGLWRCGGSVGVVGCASW